MTQKTPNENAVSKQSFFNRISNYLIPITALLLIGIVIFIVINIKPDNTQTSTTITAKNTTDSALDTPTKDADNTPVIQQFSPTPLASSFETGLEDLPASLQGTDVDGEIIIDEDKQLVVTEGLRRLFDYFLTTQGEEDIDTIILRVESYIRHHVPDPAASQAVAIFRQYLLYLDGLTALDNSYSNFQLQATRNGKLDLDLIARRKQDLTQLRKQYFDKPTIAAFFDSDDEYDEYSIAMLEIGLKESWDESQKETARQDYISRMPDNTIKNNLENQKSLQDLIERTEVLKANGASNEALYSLRRELFGAPAAARLALVDAEDQDFDQRFKQYQVQKDQLLQQGLSNDESKLQITQIEQQLFNDAERQRLTGYAEFLKLENQTNLEAR